MEYDGSPSSNPLYRIVQAVATIVLLWFLVAGYLGLRALVYNQINAIPPALMTGAWAATLVGIPLGLIYLFIGPQRLYRLPIDWISVQLGIVVGGLLYGSYNMIAPLSSQFANVDAGRRFLQGGIDGLLIGAVAGALVAFVNGRPLRLHSRGLSRYGVLYLAVLTILWVGILVYRMGGVFNLAALAVVAVLLLVARVIFWNFGGKPYQEETAVQEPEPAPAPPKKRRTSKKREVES
jgi:hypothetical protein